jgi:lipid-binding SYLF domain-containing protein
MTGLNAVCSKKEWSMRKIVIPLLLLAAYPAAGFYKYQHEAVRRIEAARVVFEEIMNIEDKSIPRELLEKAYCIGIVPGLKQGGFVVGAKYGKGVLMCRQPGGGWTGPGTIRVEGGSFGLQINRRR